MAVVAVVGHEAGDPLEVSEEVILPAGGRFESAKSWLVGINNKKRRALKQSMLLDMQYQVKVA